MRRIVCFPASLRQHSLQRRLVGYLAQQFPTTDSIDIIEPGSLNLPLYNQDLEHQAQYLQQILALAQRIQSAQAVIVATPEYNGHVSPYFKNTVDWLSRLPRINKQYSNVLYGKPVLLACATTGGSGGMLGLRDARNILNYLGSLVIPEQVNLAYAERWVLQESFQFEAPFAAHIETILKRFIEISDRLKP